MAAGKSTIGRALAERLGMPFVDMDEEIEAAAGMTVAEIFARQGEAAFRRMEREMLVQLLDGDAKVIAAGGGTFVDREYRATLNGSTDTVWLDPSFEVLLSRLRNSATRPLADRRSEAELRALRDARQESYAEAHLRISTTDDDVQRYVDEILARWLRRGRAGRSRGFAVRPGSAPIPGETARRSASPARR
jgi:shikimate kinase